MNDSDRGYIAAFFEAEGHCGIRQVRGCKYVQIRVAQKDPTVLRWMQDILEMGHIHYEDRGKTYIHHLCINRLDDTRKFMRLVYPLIKTPDKRTRMREAYLVTNR